MTISSVNNEEERRLEKIFLRWESSRTKSILNRKQDYLS